MSNKDFIRESIEFLLGGSTLEEIAMVAERAKSRGIHEEWCVALWDRIGG